MKRKFPTCGLAVIGFALRNWSEAKAGSGRLNAFVTPRDLEKSR